MDERLTKELIKTRKIVKKKYRSLKSDRALLESNKQREFKPITEPLQKLLTQIKDEPRIKEEPRDFKNETIKFGNVGSSSSPKQISQKPLLPFGGITFLEDTYLSELQDPAESRVDDTITDEVIDQEVEKSRQALQDLTQSSIYQEWLEQFSPLPRSYLDGQITGIARDYDHIYGIKHDAETAKFSIGNANVDFRGNDIKIFKKYTLGSDFEKYYEGTPGLYELLFKQTPVRYTNKDLENYMEILDKSAAYRRNYDPTQQILGTTNSKYVTIIRPYLVKKKILTVQAVKSIGQPSVSRNRSMSTSTSLNVSRLPPPAPVTRSKKKLGGFMNFSDKDVDYVYFDNPNELVDRLRLLIASQMAGHTGHHNEIMSIVEELREAKIIQ